MVNTKQKLEVYWTEDMAYALDHWGTDTTWREILYLFSALKGRVLDIACGTGTAMKLLEASNRDLEIHGADISDLMINKAIEKDISKDHLKIADVTSLPYADGEFDYSYSIGSLEHFTGTGITDFLLECKRVTKLFSFHMIPVHHLQEDQGWITTTQSYFNNSTAWWLEKTAGIFTEIRIVPSSWEDPNRSKGIWLVCKHF